MNKNAWEYRRLGDVAIFINGDRGINYPSRDEFVASGVPFINAGHIVENKLVFNNMNYITDTKFQNLGSGKVQEGDIIFCLRGSLGKYAKIDFIGPAAIASSLVIIRPKGELLHDYLYHFLGSPKVQGFIEKNNNGSSQPNLSAKSVQGFQIPFPPIGIQDNITKELNELQNVISFKKEQLKYCDQLTQSLFYEMFGHPVHNERKWPCRRLAELCVKITNGNTPKGGSQVYVDDGIMFLRSQNVWRNRMELDDVVYIDESTHTKLSASSVHNNDILITKTGRINTENSSLGRAALYTGEDNKANINGHVYLVRLKEGVVLHKFVLYILISDPFRELIRSVCVGGIDKRQLNRNHIEEFPIIVPPLELQQEYVTRIKAIERQKRIINASLQVLETLQSKRMQYWFD